MIYQSTTGISAGTNKKKDEEPNASDRTSGTGPASIKIKQYLVRNIMIVSPEPSK